jgi:hypothetical protein
MVDDGSQTACMIIGSVLHVWTSILVKRVYMDVKVVSSCGGKLSCV